MATDAELLNKMLILIEENFNEGEYIRAANMLKEVYKNNTNSSSYNGPFFYTTNTNPITYHVELNAMHETFENSLADELDLEFDQHELDAMHATADEIDRAIELETYEIAQNFVDSHISSLIS